MTKLLVFVKIYLIYFYHGLLSPVPSFVTMIINEEVKRQPPEWLLVFLLALMILPDVAVVVSPDFRNWMKSQLKTISAIGQFYASIWFLRGALVMMWLELWYYIEIRYEVYMLTVFASFGMGALSFFSKKLSKE